MSNPVIKHGEIIPQETRNLISKRYHKITEKINKELWNIDNSTLHSIYVGSYGRNTAIKTSDIDILIEVPEKYFNIFNSRQNNGQSQFLQYIKSLIVKLYPKSNIKADGQVIKIDFFDGIAFEIIPAFKNINKINKDIIYTYPDSNNGGKWKSTNPKSEQQALQYKNIYSNGLLYDTCKHIRFIRDNYLSSYHLSGILIDSFAYNAIRNFRWPYPDEYYLPKKESYEISLLKYFYNMDKILKAPGSGDIIRTEKDLICLEKVLKYMAF